MCTLSVQVSSSILMQTQAGPQLTAALWLQGSQLCTMCPANMTNLKDGSGVCDTPIIPGTNLKTRYAVIVSFGILLNGTDLDDVASKVGQRHCHCCLTYAAPTTCCLYVLHVQCCVTAVSCNGLYQAACPVLRPRPAICTCCTLAVLCHRLSCSGLSQASANLRCLVAAVPCQAH